VSIPDYIRLAANPASLLGMSPAAPRQCTPGVRPSALPGLLLDPHFACPEHQPLDARPAALLLVHGAQSYLIWRTWNTGGTKLSYYIEHMYV